jgi:hypothetical protein
MAIFGIAGSLPTFFISWFLAAIKIHHQYFCSVLKGDRHDVTIKKGVCYVTYIEKKKSAA